MADNPRQDLYLEISRNLVDEELTDLRNYVSGAKILPARFVQHADAHQICNQLEKEQKLKPGDLTLLADLLRKIGRQEYAEKAEKIAESERKDAIQILKHLLTEVTVEDSSQADTYARLARHVAESGLTFRDEVPKDGNCMFHAVADQLFRTEGRLINHMELRNWVVGFLRGHPYNGNGDHLSAFVPDQDWESYLSTMSRDGTWGDHIVLQAMADLFGHEVSIVSSVEAENYVTILTPSTGTVRRKEPPLLLGHYAENHYASLDCPHIRTRSAVCFNLSHEESHINQQKLLPSSLYRHGLHTTKTMTGPPQPCTSQLKRKGEDGEEFPGKKKPAARREEGSPVGDVFQKSVKKYYELKLSHFKPLIWNDNFTLTLSDIFTQLELVPTSEKKLKATRKSKRSESDRKEQRKELKSLDDLFNPDVTGLSAEPRCILIEGKAGGGKTTFLSKEALDAVSHTTELGRRHNIVLFIRLREVKEGETIEEMVWDQCVDETIEGIDVQSIRAILKRNKSRVLFLLDEYDELRPEARAAGQAIPKLLSGKLYLNSTIVITSRPSAGVEQHTQPDCHVHIMGFSPEHMVKYVRTYFFITESPELAEEFIQQHFTVYHYDIYSKVSDSSTESHDNEEVKVERTSALRVVLKDNKLLNSLIQTPMFLLLVCVLWEEDQEMVSTGTMTGLYDNLLTCLVRKHCKREVVDMPTEGLPTEVAESLLQFGKLALEALLRNETLLDLTEVEKEKVNWELLLKLGVVSLEMSSSKLHSRKQLNFSHKTMQEFLAGRYITNTLLNQDIVELLQLTSITKALELSNLLQFMCGCDSRAAQAVMEELSKISSREFTHVRPKQFVPMDEDLPIDRDMQKRYEMFAALCLNILSERQEPEVFQCISQTEAEALPRLPALEWLDLRYISMEPAGFQAVVQAAEEHPTLEWLDYSRDGVPEGADTTASCLKLSSQNEGVRLKLC